MEFKLRVQIANEVKPASVLLKSSRTKLEALSCRSLSNTPPLSSLSIRNARLNSINLCTASGMYFQTGSINCLYIFYFFSNGLDAVKDALLSLVEIDLAG